MRMGFKVTSTCFFTLLSSSQFSVINFVFLLKRKGNFLKVVLEVLNLRLRKEHPCREAWHRQASLADMETSQ